MNLDNYLSIEKASKSNVDLLTYPYLEKLVVDSKSPFRLPDTLSQLGELKALYLNENCTLPSNIDTCKNLTTLHLNDQGIFNVPDSIINSKIEMLQISYFGKNLDAVNPPDWLFKMKQLKKLRLSVCRFTELEKLNDLTNLLDLDLSCSLSDLTHFPDISKLKKLKKLNVSGETVQGQKLPPYYLFEKILEGIKNLDQLESLTISNWRPKKKADCLVVDNGKKSIPNIFERYPNLKELSLVDMKLDFIPESILGLKKLERLTIRRNNLSNDEVRRIISHLPYCNIDSDVVVYKARK